ncbi:MAG: zinc ribbon domain-containing protein [Candidatus Hodarchaeales archaeon]
MNDPSNEFKTITCPNCGNRVPKTSFCISCGIKLSEINQPAENSNVTTSETTKCPLCRKEVPATHNFCHFCGGRLKKDIEDQSYEICNRCWKPNPPNLDYCIHCGLKQEQKRVRLLQNPFEGFQLDLSYLLEAKPMTISMYKQGLSSSKAFPSRSVLRHSKYFGVMKAKKSKLGLFARNFGGFGFNNLVNYSTTAILVFMIYIFWYTNRYIYLTKVDDPGTDLILLLFFGSVLSILMLAPVILSTFIMYRNSGYRLEYHLDSSRIFVAVIFNIIWMFFGFYGPIFLRMGEFKSLKERVVMNRSFSKGIVIGAVFSILGSLILGIFCLLTVGLPGEFRGFIFQDHPLKSHLVTSFIGATWISLLLLMPFGDYYDKIIKNWNQVLYFILFAITLLLLTYSFRVLIILTQIY